MAGTGDAHLRESDGDVLLSVQDLVVEFGSGDETVHAVSGVSFDLRAGETLGIVGESGCGKTSTARAVAQLPPPTSGTVTMRYRGVEDRDLTAMSGDALRRMRPDLQMIFQDPISSLNPRRSVRKIIGQGLKVWGSRGAWSDARLDELMEAVGIDPRFGGRKPHQFSGGQCQRISIARALVLDPQIIICDEPVSALDVSVQAQILNLLEDMKERYGVSLLFISHDLSVVKNVSDRVMVMYMGKICEIGGSDGVYARPVHPYTRALLAAIPGASGGHLDDPVPEGDLPSAIDPPSGCRFHTRCPYATDECRETEPVLRAVGEGHFVACHHPRT